MKFNEKKILVLIWSSSILVSALLITIIFYDLYKNSYKPVFDDINVLASDMTKNTADINMNKFDSITKKIDDKSSPRISTLSRNIFQDISY